MSATHDDDIDEYRTGCCAWMKFKIQRLYRLVGSDQAGPIEMTWLNEDLLCEEDKVTESNGLY